MRKVRPSLMMVADLQAQDYTYEEIAKMCDISIGAVRRMISEYNNGDDEYEKEEPDPVEVVDVSPADLPLQTLNGTMHVLPITPPRLTLPQRRLGLSVCDVCLWCDQCCKWVMQGDFVACERPLRSDLIDYEQGVSRCQVAERPGVGVEDEGPGVFAEGYDAGGRGEGDSVHALLHPGTGPGRGGGRLSGLNGLNEDAREASPQSEWRQLSWTL